jgi:hypothetical protein
MLAALRFVHVMYGAREISGAPPCLTRVLRRASGSLAILFKSCIAHCQDPPLQRLRSVNSLQGVSGCRAQCAATTWSAYFAMRAPCCPLDSATRSTHPPVSMSIIRRHMSHTPLSPLLDPCIPPTPPHQAYHLHLPPPAVLHVRHLPPVDPRSLGQKRLVLE